ncbi:cytosine permease [Streptomyces sp. NPDC002172]
MGVTAHARTLLRAWGSTSGPKDLVSILLGSSLCLGVIIFGWLPPSFGLGRWASVSAIVAGTLIGTVLTAPPAPVSRSPSSPRPASSPATTPGTPSPR